MNKVLMRQTPAEESEEARIMGARRFGTRCQHERVENGRCVSCLRKVLTTAELNSPFLRHAKR